MAPMLCALFLAARMRALQMDPVSGNPQRSARRVCGRDVERKDGWGRKATLMSNSLKTGYTQRLNANQ